MLDFAFMDSIPTETSHRLDLRDARGQGAIVFDPARLRQAGAELFDPAHYGERAQPVSGSGGRGAAWFVRNDVGDAVLRHYRRGGWVARLSRDAYWWSGEDKVRSFREFRLTQHLRRLGLPVPAPLAAAYWRRGPVYRAALLVERLGGARSFVQDVRAAGLQAPWAEAGATIARCHAVRAHHADLNANNLLVDPVGQVWLIDWDKGRVEPGRGPWCGAVLDRLERSLRKLGVPESIVVEGMRLLRATHDRELAA